MYRDRAVPFQPSACLEESCAPATWPPINSRNIGIRLNGVERTNVEEYCISGGWIRATVGKTLDRRGRALTTLFKGTVEPFFRD